MLSFVKVVFDIILWYKKAYFWLVKQEQKIINFITLIVILTISIQVYWNYVQYANNRILVINEIQSILDNVIRDYIKELTQKSTLTDGIVTFENGKTKTDSIQNIVSSVLEELKGKKIINSKKNNDSFSYTLIRDSLNLNRIDNLLSKQFVQNKYKIDYYLTINQNGKIIESRGKKIKALDIITAKSQLTPFESVSTVNLSYANPIVSILIKGLAGIISSFFLCCIVIFALYYLLHIIRKQKQLSEIKNDFISNVTHEFKTPIATVTSAIEAIKNFNNEQITQKTKQYLDISEEQLKKLNLLVEKVMETALLESSELQINKKKSNIIKLLKNSIEKHQLTTQKNIAFESNIHYFEIEIDEFHFDNAISNLIDNAIKYGGSEIKVSVDKQEELIFITVLDNGGGISKQDEAFVFDKFFRIKNQNINTINGFGIGLYYTKKIIEMHNGIIELAKRNTFTITLWIK